MPIRPLAPAQQQRQNVGYLPGRNTGPLAFHVMVKPTGPACNLHCSYCFYLAKRKLYPGRTTYRMAVEVLESFIRQHIQAQQIPAVTFAWQGGEPTLLGLDFFQRVLEFQARHLLPGMRVTNTLQTNGTLLDLPWVKFLREHRFLVGISLDGPKKLHDRHRRDRNNRPTFDRVMRGLRLLQDHGVEHNVLCVVHRENSRHPEEVYEFFKAEGIRFIQFIPLVERLLPYGSHVQHPAPGQDISRATVAADEYGDFLCQVFDSWVRHDVGRVFVQIFDSALGATLGRPAELCIFAPTCGKAVVLEHNGDVYACDHFVSAQFKRGNLLKQPLRRMLSSQDQVRFGNNKRDRLPSVCRTCPVLFLCNGECPKNQFIKNGRGEIGLNYLCPGLKMFFNHALPLLQWMAKAYRSGRPPAAVMEFIRANDREKE